MRPSNLIPPSLSDLSAYFPNPHINVSEILLGPALPFIVIIGSPDVGKSTAVQIAASEVSTSRAVVYLPHPPSDFEFFKLFYQMPSWLKALGLLECVFRTAVLWNLVNCYFPVYLLSANKSCYCLNNFCRFFLTFRSITFSNFISHVDTKQLPVLIIDNIQTSDARLPELLSGVKHYANAEVMKIVLICSSSAATRSISKMSGMSRGLVHFLAIVSPSFQFCLTSCLVLITFLLDLCSFVGFPRLPQDLIVKRLLYRGFTEPVATQLSSQLGQSLTKIKTVSLINPEGFVEKVKRGQQLLFAECVQDSGADIQHAAVNIVESLIGSHCCSPLQECLLQANFLMYDPINGAVSFDSDLARVIIEEVR
jgi:hypothetical protein